jgi:hypothetical protein
LRIFRNKWFERFARKEGIDDSALCEAVRRAEAGKIDCDYGGGVIKQRVARPHEGKSGGYRTIILYRKSEKAFFVYGFAKSKTEDLNDEEVRVYKKAAKITFERTDDDLAKLLKRCDYEEVKYHG